jgi:rubrerythrin
MKTKIVAVLLTLMLGGVSTFAQEHSRSHQQQVPAKIENSSEMSEPSSKPCCSEMKSADCGQTEKKTEEMGHSKMDHSKMDTKVTSKEASVVYTCPMHPEVISEKPGKCPKCGMDLIKKK